MSGTGALLTVDETAALLRCSRWTVTRLIQRGELTASRIGRRWIIAEADARALLKKNQAKPAPKQQKQSGGKVWKIT